MNCKLQEPTLITEGLIRKGYFDDVQKYYLPHIALTPKGFSKIMLTESDSEALEDMLKTFSNYKRSV